MGRKRSPRRRARLLPLVGGDPGAAPVIERAAVIGRGAEAAFKVDALDASRRHARIRRTPSGSYLVEDLGSRNGTRVNGRPVRGPRRLRPGDRVEIGEGTLFLYMEEVAGGLAAVALGGPDAVARLAGGVAHEYNNALQAIRANVQFLGQAAAGQEQVRASLDDIDAAARRAARITGQLLSAAGGGRYQRAWVDLGVAARDAARFVEGSASRRVELRLALGAGLRVQGDPRQIQEALLELLLHASDGLPRGAACPFICAPASAWPRPVRPSPSVSRSRPITCSAIPTWSASCPTGCSSASSPTSA